MEAQLTWRGRSTGEPTTGPIHFRDDGGAHVHEVGPPQAPHQAQHFPFSGDKCGNTRAPCCHISVGAAATFRPTPGVQLDDLALPFDELRGLRRQRGLSGASFGGRARYVRGRARQHEALGGDRQPRRTRAAVRGRDLDERPGRLETRTSGCRQQTTRRLLSQSTAGV